MSKVLLMQNWKVLQKDGLCTHPVSYTHLCSTYFVVSVYLNTNNHIKSNCKKKIYTKIHKQNRSLDTNSLSTPWHDKITNTRERTIEESILRKNLYIIHEESESTTFHRRGASNIDLTLVNNTLITAIYGWEIKRDESYSDHNIIK